MRQGEMQWLPEASSKAGDETQQRASQMQAGALTTELSRQDMQDGNVCGNVLKMFPKIGRMLCSLHHVLLLSLPASAKQWMVP